MPKHVYLVGDFDKKPTFKRAGVQLDIGGQRVFRIVADSEFHAFKQFVSQYGDALNDRIVIERAINQPKNNAEAKSESKTESEATQEEQWHYHS